MMNSKERPPTVIRVCCMGRKRVRHADIAVILPFEVLDGIRATIVSTTEPFVHTEILQRLFADALRVDPPEPSAFDAD
ncbi:hypothetical protein DX980_00750 (plasmid) [Burkholderia gladioli]|uniref:hypothetical protein n=1 Tax=Burkholderia gladioli TaxID=28095 RepID=UPI00136494F2|nr:hypothetical protein [Burkholderia gladioli]WAG17898.1 hypothetical protein DX980_00750 [Burkholderia gladioli]